MAAVTPALIKELREKTGAGMMDCKKALTEVNGDMEEAIAYLREKGLASSGKKAGRVAAEGAAGTYVSDDGKTGALIEVNCETDFVAKNEKFQAFVKDCAAYVATADDADVKETLDGKAKEMIATIGENIVVRRFEKYEMSTPGTIGAYVHMGGKIGVLVEVGCESDAVCSNDAFASFVKDVAMHIAAAAPRYLDKDSVDAKEVEKEREILKAQAVNEGKPENIAEKMVNGRINKMYKEICLLEQPFVKDPDKTIAALVKEVSSQLGETVVIRRFVRYLMGEGLEKKQENFAEEIAKQAGL